MSVNPRSKDAGVYSLKDSEVKELTKRFSKARLEIYKEEAKQRGVKGASDRHALVLHNWNTELSAALRGTLEQFEIVLRNSLDEVLTAESGVDWYNKEPWSDSPMVKKTKETLEQKVEESKYLEKYGQTHIRTEARGKKRQGINHDNMVASLYFSYWCALFYQKRFYPIASRVFRRKPKSIGEREVTERLKTAVEIRNIIAHLEPIILLDLPELEDELIEFISWISLTTAKWMKQNSRLKSIYNFPPELPE